MPLKLTLNQKDDKRFSFDILKGKTSVAISKYLVSSRKVSKKIARWSKKGSRLSFSKVNYDWGGGANGFPGNKIIAFSAMC